MAESTVITEALLIQDTLIALLAADDTLKTAFAPLVATNTGLVQIKDFDPEGVDPLPGLDLAIDLMQEADDDASLATRRDAYVFSLWVYVAATTRESTAKRQLVGLSRILRNACMRHRTATAPDGSSLWYKNRFLQPSTKYFYSDGGYRVSVSFLQILSRYRTT